MKEEFSLGNRLEHLRGACNT